MGMEKVAIKNGDKLELATVCANVASGFLVIEGRRIKIEEVNLPSHKYEACFVKGRNSRLYR